MASPSFYIGETKLERGQKTARSPVPSRGVLPRPEPRSLPRAPSLFLPHHVPPSSPAAAVCEKMAKAVSKPLFKCLLHQIRSYPLTILLILQLKLEAARVPGPGRRREYHTIVTVLTLGRSELMSSLSCGYCHTNCSITEINIPMPIGK